MARIGADEAGGMRVLSFLDAIAWSECKGLLALSDDGYNLLVGSTPHHVVTFDSYADHPDRLEQAGPVMSTAAGRYQILHRTWVPLKALLKLTDFGPVNQDRAALQLITECRALHRIVAGDIRNACYMCNKTWASLPGAGYGQPENDIDAFADAYYGALERYLDAQAANLPVKSGGLQNA